MDIGAGFDGAIDPHEEGGGGVVNQAVVEVEALLEGIAGNWEAHGLISMRWQ